MSEVLSSSAGAKTGPCDCEKCRVLCVGRPGWFAPGEATRAAAELGLTLAQFFKQYLTVDYWCDAEHGDTLLLSPAWNNDAHRQRFASTARREPDMLGRRASWSDGLLNGPCRLLTQTGCRLSFEARPSECRKAYGCGGSPAKGMREGIVEMWKHERGELVQLGFIRKDEP